MSEDQTDYIADAEEMLGAGYEMCKKSAHKKLQIIYKNNKPYGIRDDGGYLLFFADVSKFPGQEQRYREEVQEQYALAEFLLETLQRRTTI